MLPIPTRAVAGNELSSGFAPGGTRQVEAGYYFVHAIRNDGTLWAWGSDSFSTSVLGTGRGLETTPSQVMPGTTWKSISNCATHAAGIQTDGSLWMWGRKTYYWSYWGADNGVFRWNTPTQFSDFTDWVSVSTAEAEQY